MFPREDTIEKRAKIEAERLGKEEAKQEEKAKKEEEARKGAQRLAKERAKRGEKVEKEEELAGIELYQGVVKLVIEPPIGLDQLSQIQGYLGQVKDLRLVLVGGSAGEGVQIFVSVEKPTPLIDVLREMPVTEEVVKKDKEIKLTLKVDK